MRQCIVKNHSFTQRQSSATLLISNNGQKCFSLTKAFKETKRPSQFYVNLIRLKLRTPQIISVYTPFHYKKGNPKCILSFRIITLSVMKGVDRNILGPKRKPHLIIVS